MNDNEASAYRRTRSGQKAEKTVMDVIGVVGERTEDLVVPR